jgi:ribosome-associated protein
MEDLVIHPNIHIDSAQLKVVYSRSSGPGGQHVNKLNTKVTIFLDVQKCPDFSERQKHAIKNSLFGRMNKRGVLRVSSQQYRSQTANLQAAFKRMAELIEHALKPKRIRKKTHVPKRAIEKRLRDKKTRSVLKKLRSGRQDIV